MAYAGGPVLVLDWNESGQKCLSRVMDKDDEYRKFAQEAKDLADNSRNPTDKASWLKIAESWLRMLSKEKRTLPETFDDTVRERGTGQQKSDQSH